MSSQTIVIKNIGDIQQVFQQAAQSNTPVYVYQAAAEGGAKLDFSGLNKIIEVDADNLVAVVEAGVRLSDLAEVLKTKGLRYVPAESECYRQLTIGEFIYMGSPNIYSHKYGNGKFFLMGGDFVLPSGEIMATGGKTVKNVTGYDFVRFFTGAYSDLAIGVKFVLKLLPLPETRLCYKVESGNLQATMSFIHDMRNEAIIPSYILWVDAGIRKILSDGSLQLVALELDGVAEEVAKYSEKVKELLKRHQALNFTEPDINQADKIFGRLYTGKNVLIDEYKILSISQAQFMTQAYEVLEKTNPKSGLFGQVAEGKINLYLDELGPAQKDIIMELAELAKKFGGVSTGKFQRIYGENCSGRLAVLEQEMKKRFDPLNLLNRRKEAAL